MKRILAVDDEPDVLETVEEVLSDYSVQTAGSFEAASRLLDTETYDMVILDIMGVRGLDLLDIAVEQNFPAVMLTAHTLDPGNVMESMLRGAVSFITKENIDQLDSLLEELFDLLEKGQPTWVHTMKRLALVLDACFSPIRRFKDVSRELASARAKLQTVELMKQVLMSGPETSIMVVDEDLKILEINNAILERTKMSQEDCIGRLCHWIIRKELKPCYSRGERCGVREVIQKGRAVITVREERRDDGSSRYFTINSYPLPEDERGKKNVMIVWRDVSKQMRPVLNRQARYIQRSFTDTLQQQKMAALGKLASSAAHEINNPIQGILSFAKLMRQSFDKESLTQEEMERFRSYLDLISAESERCGKIVQGLLSFASKKNLRKSAVDLTTIFEDIALLIGNRMKIQGISLRIEKPGITPIAHCDGDQIKQALLNIILNSVEAMPNGGLITVSAEPSPDGKSLIIRIQDTGPGIPENVRSKLFEPFYTTKKDGQGTGLGLSVVYGIMWQHGATIDVESTKEKGTTFIISLPIAEESPG
ncbi:MAG: ATP-binding protein [Desulfomonilaceae bacterium]